MQGLNRLVVSNIQAVVIDKNAGGKAGRPHPVLITDRRLGDIGRANYLFRHFEELFTLVPGGTKSDFQVYNFYVDPRLR